MPVFARKLVASIEQRIMLEKALGKVKVDPDEKTTNNVKQANKTYRSR